MLTNNPISCIILLYAELLEGNMMKSVDMEEGLKSMLGRQFVRVSGGVGEKEMVFECEDGSKFVFYHEFDCCEYVRIEDVVGDLQDLVGVPLLMADEVTNRDDPVPEPEHVESYTWTYYKFATRKGYVDVRWLGDSNGYYSEEVHLKVEKV